MQFFAQDPVWDLGFAVDDVSGDEGPNAPTLPAAQRGMEITVGVKDRDPFGDEFIGKCTFVLDPNAASKNPAPIEIDLMAPNATEMNMDAEGETKVGTLIVKVGAKTMLASRGAAWRRQVRQTAEARWSSRRRGLSPSRMVFRRAP